MIGIYGVIYYQDDVPSSSSLSMDSGHENNSTDKHVCIILLARGGYSHIIIIMATPMFMFLFAVVMFMFGLSLVILWGVWIHVEGLGAGLGAGGGGSERGGGHEGFFFLRRRPKLRLGFSWLTRRNVPTKFASIRNSRRSSPTIMCQCSSIEGMSLLQDQYLYIDIHHYKSCFPCNSFS